jgi:hypothetical protein
MNSPTAYHSKTPLLTCGWMRVFDHAADVIKDSHPVGSLDHRREHSRGWWVKASPQSSDLQLAEESGQIFSDCRWFPSRAKEPAVLDDERSCSLSIVHMQWIDRALNRSFK